MIDAGPIGNFGRFINHQDTPNAEAQSVVIDKNLAIKKGVIDEEDIEVIKDIEFLEVMGLYVLDRVCQRGGVVSVGGHLFGQKGGKGGLFF